MKLTVNSLNSFLSEIKGDEVFDVVVVHDDSDKFRSLYVFRKLVKKPDGYIDVTILLISPRLKDISMAVSAILCDRGRYFVGCGSDPYNTNWLPF